MSKKKWFRGTAVLAVVLVGIGYYLARHHWHPTRPLFGEPTPAHFEQFARRLNNRLVGIGVPVTHYEAELRRTDSLTNPLVGDFNSLLDGRLSPLHFAWRDGKWVELSGRVPDDIQQAIRDAQR